MCKNPSSAPQYLIKQVIADLCASFALLLGGTGNLRAIPRSCGDSGRCAREVSSSLTSSAVQHLWFLPPQTGWLPCDAQSRLASSLALQLR
jgi:hypothetical protein